MEEVPHICPELQDGLPQDFSRLVNFYFYYNFKAITTHDFWSVLEKVSEVTGQGRIWGMEG